MATFMGQTSPSAQLPSATCPYHPQPPSPPQPPPHHPLCFTFRPLLVFLSCHPTFHSPSSLEHLPSLFFSFPRVWRLSTARSPSPSHNVHLLQSGLRAPARPTAKQRRGPLLAGRPRAGAAWLLQAWPPFCALGFGIVAFELFYVGEREKNHRSAVLQSYLLSVSLVLRLFLRAFSGLYPGV